MTVEKNVLSGSTCIDFFLQQLFGRLRKINLNSLGPVDLFTLNADSVSCVIL